MAAPIRLLDGTQLVAVLESYESLRVTRKLWEPNTFALDLSRHDRHATALTEGRIILPPGDASGVAYRIDQIQLAIGGDDDRLKVTGRDLSGMLADPGRLVIPPAGQSHDAQVNIAAETAMKWYVDRHAGPGAPAARQLPNLVIAADQGRGGTVTALARFQSLAEVIGDLGRAGGLGYQITFNAATGQFVFDVIAGVDRSASVYLDLDFDALQQLQWLRSERDRLTTVYVAGQGEGAAREIVTVHDGGIEPTGFDRHETFLDARDVDNTAALTSRGQAALAEGALEDAFSVDIHQHGSFRYQEHWDLGDILMVRNTEWDLLVPRRVVTVESSITPESAVPVITAELGKPWPSIESRVKGLVPATTEATVAPLSIDTGKIADQSVTPDKLAAGTVLQVVTVATVTTTATTSTIYQATTLSANFTPRRATSRVFVELTGLFSVGRVTDSPSDRTMRFRVLETTGSVTILEMKVGRILTAGSSVAATSFVPATAIGSQGMNSTAQRTYELQIRVDTAGLEAKVEAGGTFGSPPRMTIWEVAQ